MAGELESFGDAITGGVLARAVEPRPGDTAPGADGHTHESACLNCGTKLRGEFCHACGQKGHVHRTLGAFGHDLLHGVLHFEGKAWRTLPMLAWRPGQLTRRYIEGERARFVSPLALFLFSVFLMFAVMGWTGGLSWGEQTQANVDNGLAESVQETQEKLREEEVRRERAATAGEPTTEQDARLKELRDELSMLQLMRERGITEATMVRASDDLPSRLNWLESAYRKAKANPSLLFYKIQNSAYKYSWALIPISVPFMWLLFPFSRKFRLYDHTVFVTYSLCFMTLLAVAFSLLRAGGATAVAAVLILCAPPVHIFLQLKGAYRLRWWSALLRTVVLLIFIGLTTSLFALMLLALGVLG